MTRYLWLDTNVFEQFPQIDQIDWLGAAECEHATLVVPQITLRELNKHKDMSPKGRLRRRAANALSFLSKLADLPQPTTVRENVDLIFLNHDPILDFAEHHLSRELA